MANILEKFGAKEVVDLGIYKINSTTGARDALVLFLDTLKVFTVDQTTETVHARGGKGAPKLITWEHSKEINVTIEDALFSMKSLSFMFGANGATKSATSVTKVLPFVGATAPTKWTDVAGNQRDITGAVFYDAAGATVASGSLQANTPYYAVFSVTGGTGYEIEISADKFPGTYYLEGYTYARSEIDGRDDEFQFIIPKAKIKSDQSVSLDAEGDPSTFSMDLEVLKPTSGPMMKMVLVSLPVAAG